MPYLLKYMLQRPDVQEKLRGVQMPLQYFHRHMHTYACQAKHAAHFYKGSGWPFGEVAERKWSRLIELSKRAAASSVAKLHVMLECFWQRENLIQDVRALKLRAPFVFLRIGGTLRLRLTLAAGAVFTGEVTSAAGFLDGAGEGAAHRPGGSA